MARAVISDPRRRTAYEPLYDIDPQTGASVEVFYADCALAKSFSARGEGWFWWSCQPNLSAGWPPDWPLCYQLCRLPQFRAARFKNREGAQSLVRCFPPASPKTDGNRVWRTVDITC